MSEKLLTFSAAKDSNLLLSASAVQLFIFALPAAFYCKIRGVEFFEFSKLKRLHLSEIPFVIAAAFTCFFAAIILMYIHLNLFHTSSGDSATVIQSAESDPFGVLLAYVIVPAFAEEFFFRSILISDYSKFKGPCTVTISALFFAMLHFSFSQFPMYFLIGIILATVTYVTDTTFPATVIHLIYNATVVFMGEELSKFLKESSTSVILAFILTVAFMLSLAAMLSSMENIYAARSELFIEGKLPGSRRASVNEIAKAGKVGHCEEKHMLKTSSVLLSPTFFLCILTFILITIDII